LSTASERARRKPASSVGLAVIILMRNSSGSTLAAAAASSMNDSAAKVACGPLGSRRLPVRSGVSQTAGSPTTSPVILRLGITYMSDGTDALPPAGRARRVPISCAMSTVSGSL